MALTKVVIIGAGPAGVRCARGLYGDKRFAVTLISNTADLVCNPSAASGTSASGSLTLRLPLATVFANPRNVRLVIGEVIDIDTTAQAVRARNTTLSYDQLVIAIGVVGEGIAGLRAGTDIPSEAHFEVHGTGPISVTVAADLATHGHVELIEAAPRILPDWPEAFARRVDIRLKQLGIQVKTSVPMRRSTPLPDNADRSGLRSIAVGERTLSPLLHQFPQSDGRLKVVELIVEPSVWAAGDCAATSYSGWTATAIYDGGYIATSLKRMQSHDAVGSYSPPEPAPLVCVGPKWCAAVYRGRYLYGYSGWLARRWLDYRLFRMLMPQTRVLRHWLRQA